MAYHSIVKDAFGIDNGIYYSDSKNFFSLSQTVVVEWVPLWNVESFVIGGRWLISSSKCAFLYFYQYRKLHSSKLYLKTT